MTRFEEFKANAQRDIQAYRREMDREGLWSFKESAKLLQELQNKMSYRLMIYLFDKQLGEHLYDSLRHMHQGNILNWLTGLNEEFYIYVLAEVKTNKSLYAHC